MTNRNWIKLPTLALCIAALGLVYCGEETTEEPTPSGKDAGGLPPGPDGGTTTTDAGTQPKPDGGSTTTDAGIVLQELQNVSLKDVRTNIGNYVDTSARKTKAIVNVVGARIVSTYAHTGSSAGNYSIYVEEGTGAERGGLLVYYKPPTGESVPAVGSTVDVRGCVNVRYSVVQIQWCGDAENTQVAFSNVQAGTLPDVTAADTIAPAELAGDSTSHDDHLGLRIQVDGSVTVEADAPECVNDQGTWCLKPDNGGYIKTSFVHKCDASLLTGSFVDLVGVWDWQEQGTNKFRTVVPLSCDALTAAKPQ